MLPAPVGPLHSGMAGTCGPPSGDWLHISWNRSLNLAAMDMKLVAVN